MHFDLIKAYLCKESQKQPGYPEVVNEAAVKKNKEIICM